jgi:putative restriction endonuclease
MKAVCDTKATNNLYGDALPDYYEFGSRYLDDMRSCVGDWVVFRQPRSDNGDMRYFAIAIVDAISEPSASGRYVANLRDFAAFGERVSWRTKTGDYREASLNAVTPRDRMGYYLEGRSVRQIGDQDFAEIVDIGLEVSIANDESAKHAPILNFERLRRDSTESRSIRDRAFSKAVISAYQGRCAVTGLIIKSGKKFEAQAAHIWSVADGGPDAVQNGVALSATAHWLFDNGVISLMNDFSLKINKKILPGGYLNLIGDREKLIILPSNPTLRPHVEYITRSKFYKNKRNA